MTRRIKCLMVAGLLLGCADGDTATAAAKTKPPTSKDAQQPSFVFYPPAPAEPRVQYLTSYSKDTDLGGGPGKFAKFLVGKEPPRKAIAKPHGIAVHQNQIVVCDTSARSLVVLDLKKKSMEIVRPEGEGQLKSPIGIAIDADSTRYVADSARGQVLVFDKDNGYLGAIGETNMRPTGVTIVKDRLYVTDIAGGAVIAYDKATRKSLFRFPDRTSQTNQLIAPTALASDSLGQIYASEMTIGQVAVFDAAGKLLRTVGQLGDRPGEFSRPKGVATDRDNRLYVVDAATAVVQVFDEAGRVLMFFGDPKSGAGALELPAGIAIDYDHVDLFQRYAAPDFKLDHVVLVTSQLGDRRVSVYGFGRKQ